MEEGPDAGERLEAAISGSQTPSQTSTHDEKPPEPEKPAAAPAEPVVPVFTPPEDKPAASKDKLDEVEMPRFHDPKKAEHWERLKTVAREERAALQKQYEDEKRAFVEKLQTYEKQKADFEKQIGELRPFRAAVDVIADPEFQKKYEVPFQAKVAQAGEILKRFGVDENSIKGIDWKNETALEEIALAIEEKSKAQANVFRRHVGEIGGLQSARDAAVNEARAKHDELVSQQLKDKQLKATEYDTRGTKKINEIVSARDEKGQPKFWWLNKMDAAALNGKVDSAQIENHNRFVDAKLEQIRLLSRPQDPETQVDMASAVVLAEIQTYQLENALKRIGELETELKRRSNATDFTKGSKAPTPAAPRKVDASMNAEAALHASFPQHFSEPLND